MILDKYGVGFNNLNKLLFLSTGEIIGLTFFVK